MAQGPAGDGAAALSRLTTSDRPADGGGPASGLIQGIDPRSRLLVAAAFAVVVVALNTLPGLFAALLVATGLAILAGLPARPTLRRLAAMDAFMVVIVMVVPFTESGRPLVALGPLVASAEGLRQAAEIVLTANGVMLATLALAGTIEPVVLGHALARLGMPEKLVHLLLFTVRYIALLEAEYARLRLAMTARGFRGRGGMHTWRSLGWLFGMLLVRSFERSERILAAMKCRGFTGRYHLIDTAVFSARDAVFALVVGGGMIALVTIEAVV